MSILVVSIPPRRRLRASNLLDGAGDAASLPDPAAAARSAASLTEYAFVLSADGVQVQQQGRAFAALLPRADSVVAMLSDGDVGWHRLPLPRAPAARMRAALAGVLEEAVLDDAENTHFALAPGAASGQPAWVAAVNRPWLRGELAALERAQVFVDRVVPAAWPDDPPGGHFAESFGDVNFEGGVGTGDADGPAHAGAAGVIGAAGTAAHGLILTWSHADGVASLRLHGTLARAVVPQPAPEGTRWSATPGAAAAAEQWLGSTVNVMTPAQRALQAARTLWNLRQFELTRKTRGTRALRDAWRQFRSRPWRPVRWGLAALAAAQLLGLNLWAWHQSSLIADKRRALVSTLQTSFPQVRAVLDAPLQMDREVQTLRGLAGKPGDADLEPMLQAAALAWPPGRPPVDSLRFEPGRLTLAAAGWAEPEIEQFRSQLRPAGWDVAAADGRIMLSRAAAGSLLR